MAKRKGAKRATAKRAAPKKAAKKAAAKKAVRESARDRNRRLSREDDWMYADDEVEVTWDLTYEER